MKIISLFILNFYLLISCKGDPKIECSVILGEKEKVSCSDNVEIKEILVACIENDTLFYAIQYNNVESEFNEVSPEYFHIVNRKKEDEYLKSKQVYISAKLIREGDNFYVEQWFRKGLFQNDIKFELHVTR